MSIEQLECLLPDFLPSLPIFAEIDLEEIDLSGWIHVAPVPVPSDNVANLFNSDAAPTADPMQASPVLSFRDWQLLKPVDWRFRMAQAIVAGQNITQLSRQRYFDGYVEEAVAYLREANQLAPGGVVESHAAIRCAQDVREAGGMLEAELQARVLARQRPEAIAQRMQIPLNTVDSYCRLFFDIADRLEHHWIIMAAVFPEMAMGEVDSGDPKQVLLKFFAFRGGPFVLEQFLRYCRTPQPNIPNILKATKEELDLARDWQTVHRCVLLHTTPTPTDKDKILFARAIRNL